MAINKISSQTKQNILNKTAYSLPDNPSEAGMTPAQIKRAFYKGVVDSENAITSEIDRIVDETNEALSDKADKWKVSDELTLYANEWNGDKMQTIHCEIDTQDINEIVVASSSAEYWYECGVYALRETDAGIVFYAKILPQRDLKFKIVSMSAGG